MNVQPEEWRRRRKLGEWAYLEDAFNATTDAERDEAWASFWKRVGLKRSLEMGLSNSADPADAYFTQSGASQAKWRALVEEARAYWRALGGADEDFREKG